MSDLILVNDDDPDVRSVVDIRLRLAGSDEAIRVLAEALRSAASRVGDGSNLPSDRRTGA